LICHFSRATSVDKLHCRVLRLPASAEGSHAGVFALLHPVVGVGGVASPGLFDFVDACNNLRPADTGGSAVVGILGVCPTIVCILYRLVESVFAGVECCDVLITESCIGHAAGLLDRSAAVVEGLVGRHRGVFVSTSSPSATRLSTGRIADVPSQSHQKPASRLLEDSFLSQLVPDSLVEAFDPGEFPVESSHLVPEIFQNIHRVLQAVTAHCCRV